MKLIKLAVSIIITVTSFFGIYYTLCLAAYTTSVSINQDVKQ
jgi:hypothetical protein